MHCPICDSVVKDTDRQCACGELLTPWRTISFYGAALRQRGLALAERSDYLGACLSFLEAALTNPMDVESRLDTARALLHMERPDAALRILSGASSDAATALAREAQMRLEQTQVIPSRSGARESAHATLPPDIESQFEPHTPTASQSPPAKALLALGALRAKRSWRRSRRRDQDDALWTMALECEAQWQGNWSALRSWLQFAVGRSSAVHYMLGLGYWQEADLIAAKEAFTACIEDRPLMLNASAYYLCLHLNDAQQARDAWTVLTRSHPRKELDHLLPALSARLAAWGNLDQVDVLRSVASLDNGF